MPSNEPNINKIIKEGMFQDMFRNLKTDSTIQPIQVFNECMDCAKNFISATNAGYEEYKKSLDILKIPENKNYYLSEFIFLAYLRSTIDYDSFNKNTFTNNELQQIYRKMYARDESGLLNHLTPFLKSYKLYIASQKGLNIIDKDYNFQTNFFSFLKKYEILKCTTTDFDYAIPLTITPILIHIIYYWSFSFKSIVSPKTINEVFGDFFTPAGFKTDKAYELFTKYFLSIFFANTYITQFVQNQVFPHHFEYSPDDARLFRNEWNKYDNLLYNINESIPFLALKRIFVLHAYELYKLNTTYIIDLQTDYTDIEDITISSENFINELHHETEQMINIIRSFMNKNLSKDITGNNFKIQPLTATYFDSLQEIFESYKLAIEKLTDQYNNYLFKYIYCDHNTISTIFNSTSFLAGSKCAIPYSMTPDYNPLEPQPNKYKNNDETYQEIMKFSAHISEFIQKAMAKHKATFLKKYPCKKSFNAIDSFCRELEKINGFIKTLKKNLTRNPPIQKYTFPKYETTYDPFIYEMRIATNTYEYLFEVFYEKLISLADKNPEIPLWHTLHICISKNLEMLKKILEPSK